MVYGLLIPESGSSKGDGRYLSRDYGLVVRGVVRSGLGAFNQGDKRMGYWGDCLLCGLSPLCLPRELQGNKGGCLTVQRAQ